MIDRLLKFVFWFSTRVTGNDKEQTELFWHRLITWLKLYCWQNFFFWGAAVTFYLTVCVKGIDSTACLSPKNLVVLNLLLLLYAVEFDFIAADRGQNRYPFFYQALQNNSFFRDAKTSNQYLKFKGYLFLFLFLAGGAFFTYFELRDKGNCSGLWVIFLRVLCIIFLIQTVLLMVDALVENRD